MEQLIAQKEWRNHARKTILSNTQSAKAVHKDLLKAQAAKGQGCRDLLNTRGGKNAKRDFMRKMQQDNDWPGLYWAEVPFADLKTGKIIRRKMPFLLPHEWLPLYMRHEGARDDLSPQEESVRAHLQKMAAQLRVDLDELVGLGLHGDGVPINGTMNEDSLEVFNLNMTTSRLHKGMRIPFTMVQLKHCVPDETFEAITDVLVWSMRCLATGQKPQLRHDLTPFDSKQDEKRRVSPGQGSLGARAVLVEIRGDWKWLQALYKFPGYNKLSGLCWRCTCTLKSMRTMDSSSASWRFQRLTGEQFLDRLRKEGKKISKLFSLPGVSPDLVFPDWMHSADMGVTMDVIAHVFREVLPFYDGDAPQKIKGLFQDILKYYEIFKVKDRLQTLDTKNFTCSGEGKANKMKCKASQARALVSFLPLLCEKHFRNGDERQKTIWELTKSLAECYRFLGKEITEQELKQASRRLANAYCALEAEVLLENPDSAHWRIKPKLHLFQELCEFGARDPQNFWCYMDETFGNVCAILAVRRGGYDNPAHNTENVLNSWCCQTDLPRPTVPQSNQ